MNYIQKCPTFTVEKCLNRTTLAKMLKFVTEISILPLMKNNAKEVFLLCNEFGD